MGLSKHIVGLATGADLVTNELLVDTGLMEVDGAMCCLGQDATADDGLPSCTIIQGTGGQKAKLLLKVMAVDGLTAGTNPTLVRWWATGR